MSYLKPIKEGKTPIRCRGITALGIFFYFIVNTSALAQAPVTYNFTTDPPAFPGGCPSCLFEGQTVSGSFVYDPDAAFLFINALGLSIYGGGISDWSMSVGDSSFSDDIGLAIVGDNNVQGTRDVFGFLPGFTFNGFTKGGFELVDVRMLWLEGFPGDPDGTPDFLTNQNLLPEPPDFPGFLFLDFENPTHSGTTFTVNFQNLLATRAPTTVTIDIKPGSATNSINPESLGIIPVAILTTDTFDALQVDPLSVTFGVLPVSEAHSRGHVEDVDGDGDADLLLHFETQATDIGCMDTEVFLSGETFDGNSIIGSDTISTLGCP
jgi:hypothetical protein